MISGTWAKKSGKLFSKKALKFRLASLFESTRVPYKLSPQIPAAVLMENRLCDVM
jgi:hypothetical protein